jgi:hypothetical protein
MTTVMLKTTCSGPFEVIAEGTLLAVIALLPEKAMRAELTSRYHEALERPLVLGNVELLLGEAEWTALAETFAAHADQL